jgi:DNA-directed RNA polymerase subunit RPC12/RpoP
MQDRLTGYEPNVYQCPDCGTVLTEESLGVRPINHEGVKELHCTHCNSNQVALVKQKPFRLKLGTSMRIIPLNEEDR